MGTSRTYERGPVMEPIRIYLAGPDVFLHDARDIGERKKAICINYGFEGAFPLDNEVSIEGRNPVEIGMEIAMKNERQMASCHLLIANLTPFPETIAADDGTAYEMGYMRALDRPILAYSNVIGTYKERVTRSQDLRNLQGSKGVDLAHARGMRVEDFNMVHNLMLDSAVRYSGAKIFTPDRRDSDSDDLGIDLDCFRDLRAFERCLGWFKDNQQGVFEATERTRWHAEPSRKFAI